MNATQVAQQSVRRAMDAAPPTPPMVVWLVGLSGAGKSTIARGVAARIRAQGRPVFVLDADDVRAHLSSDLGFSEADRIENGRRLVGVARLLFDAGMTVLTASISPFAAGRSAARAAFPAGAFFEVFVDAPLATVERRDVKGLYARARDGALKGMTGLDSPFEPPAAPDLRLATAERTPQESCAALLKQLERWQVTARAAT